MSSAASGIRSQAVGDVLDSRTKILLCGLSLIAGVAVPGIGGKSLVLATLVITAILARISISSVRIIVISLAAFALSAFALRAIAQAQWYGDVRSWHGVEYSPIGLFSALTLWLQIASVILSLHLLVSTTRPVSLSEGLESLLSPLQRLGIPVHIATITFIIVLRFLPIMTDEFSKLTTAQMSRGSSLVSRGPISRGKAVMSLLIPMFIASLTRARDLAEAMESRGFDGRNAGTPIRTLRFGKADAIALGLGLIIVMLSIAIAVN